MTSPFLHIVKKEALVFLRDRAGMIAILVVPIITLLLFNEIISVDLRSVKVAAVVEKPSERAVRFLQPLTDDNVFEYYGTIPSVEDGRKMFRQDKIHAMVVLSKDFDRLIDGNTTAGGEAKPTVQIITDNSNTILGAKANYYIQSALNPRNMDYVTTNVLYNPGFYSCFQFGVGCYTIFLIVLCVYGASISMVREREQHSIDAILMSPVSIWKLLLAKLATNLLINCVTVTAVILMMHFIIGLPMRGSLPAFVASTLIIVLATMFLGAFISLSSATETNALTMSMLVVCLPLLYFSGAMFPTDSLPDWAQFLSGIIYAKWYIDAVIKILLQGGDFASITKEMFLLLVNMFAFLGLCIYKIKDDRWLK